MGILGPLIPSQETALPDRRDTLKAGSLLALLAAQGLVSLREARAASQRAGFEAATLAGALAALGGQPAGSEQVVLTALDVVEDGAVAPVGVLSRLPGTTEIHLLVEKNPVPLSASFSVPPGTVPELQLRVKMAESSRVFAVVRAEGRLYLAQRHTEVTLGSCGG